MIRDRIKRAARKVAIKAFGMEFDTQDRPDDPGRASRAAAYDPSKIPRVVQGSGDTPGPNHKELVGHVFLGAQVSSGATEIIVDTRPPEEWVAGIILNAMLLPNTQILEHLDRLPNQDTRVTFYDATGEQGARELAIAVRDRGWKFSRALEGGWASWIEHDEPTTQLPRNEGASFQIGDPVELKDGRRGVIQASGATYSVLLDYKQNTVVHGLKDGDLKR